MNLFSICHDLSAAAARKLKGNHLEGRKVEILCYSIVYVYTRAGRTARLFSVRHTHTSRGRARVGYRRRYMFSSSDDAARARGWNEVKEDVERNLEDAARAAESAGDGYDEGN